MIEIKILCHCGAKYKFEVEPLEGRLPGPVLCPVCKLDGTDLGNQRLAELMAATPEPRVEAASPAGKTGAVRVAPMRVGAQLAVASSSPVPAAATSDGSAPPPSLAASALQVPSSSAPRLSVAGGPAHAPHAAPPPPPPPAPPATGRSVGRLKAKGSSGRATGEPGLGAALFGAGAGALVGMLVWMGVIVLTSRGVGIIAILIGALSGWGIRLTAGSTHYNLGMIAAGFTLAGILMGTFLSVRILQGREIEKVFDEIHTEMVADAKRASALKSTSEFRDYIAESASDGEEVVPASAISDEDIADFKKEELPRLKKIASGQIGREELSQEFKAAVFEQFGPVEVFKTVFGVKMLLWLVFGMGAAYRTAQQG